MANHIMEQAELESMLKGQLSADLDTDIWIGCDDPQLHLQDEDIRWWKEAKVGLFIHWGIYSLLEKGEWVYFNEKITEDAYRTIAEVEFKPELKAKDIAKGWIDAVKDAGMQYAVMVTRHHDGYALWDSKKSWKDFTSMATAPKEDYVEAFAEECHKRDVRMGLYYSPMDWRFPGYFEPETFHENALLMKEQAYGQLEELSTKYGKVDILWYDGGWLAHKGNDADAAWLWEPIKLNKRIRMHQSKIMFTPRSGYKGDFLCDEGPHEVKGNIVQVPWEKCMSISSAWGYIPNDKYWSLEYILTMLVNVVCRGGNLLLNVGPDKNGIIPEEAKMVLHGMGEWLKENGEAIYGTSAGVWEPTDNVYGTTCRENIIYLHILDPVAFENRILPPIDYKIVKVCSMKGECIRYSQDMNGIKIHVPDYMKIEHKTDTIVKIFLEG